MMGRLRPFTAINHAFQSIRNDPETTLFGFDQYGHVFIHQTTHNIIRQLWEQLYASHAPTVGGPTAGDGAALAGFNPPISDRARRSSSTRRVRPA